MRILLICVCLIASASLPGCGGSSGGEAYQKGETPPMPGVAGRDDNGGKAEDKSKARALPDAP